MAKITKEYANANNGGKERVSRDGDKYYINSYLPSSGWTGELAISRGDAERCLSHTNAPSDVVKTILGQPAGIPSAGID